MGDAQLSRAATGGQYRDKQTDVLDLCRILFYFFYFWLTDTIENFILKFEHCKDHAVGSLAPEWPPSKQAGIRRKDSKASLASLREYLINGVLNASVHRREASILDESA